MKFTYKTRSAEDVKQRANQQGSMYDSPYKPEFTVFSPKDGDNTVRILPPTFDAAKHYGMDIWVHSSVGADNQTYLCPQKMEQGHCLICEEVERARQAGEDEYAGQLKPYRRVLCWVVNRKEEKAGPVLYPMPWTLDRDISAISVDKASGEILLIDHPDDGYDIDFKREGKPPNVKYVGISVRRRSSPVSDDIREAEKWLDFITKNPLTSVLHFYPDEHIEKVLKAKSTRASGGEARTQDASSVPATRARLSAPAESAAARPTTSTPDSPPFSASPQPRPRITDPKASLDGDDQGEPSSETTNRPSSSASTAPSSQGSLRSRIAAGMKK